jgi:hypothetical protein
MDRNRRPACLLAHSPKLRHSHDGIARAAIERVCPSGLPAIGLHLHSGSARCFDEQIEPGGLGRTLLCCAPPSGASGSFNAVIDFAVAGCDGQLARAKSRRSSHHAITGIDGSAPTTRLNLLDIILNCSMQHSVESPFPSGSIAQLQWPISASTEPVQEQKQVTGRNEN